MEYDGEYNPWEIETSMPKIDLLGGQPNTSVANTFGYGNLPEYGVPNIMTTDEPAGLRICLNTTAWSCATLLASTWNTELVKQVGKAETLR